MSELDFLSRVILRKLVAERWDDGVSLTITSSGFVFWGTSKTVDEASVIQLLISGMIRYISDNNYTVTQKGKDYIRDKDRS